MPSSTWSWSTLQELFMTLVHPWLFMFLSAQHIPVTVRTLFADGDYISLVRLSAFCDALFGQFWATAGPRVKTSAEVRVIPLLEGRVRGGAVQATEGEAAVGPPVGGTVVEIGAGSGNWVDVFLKINTGVGRIDNGGDEPRGDTTGVVRNRAGARSDGAGAPGGIRKIYGIEPNPQSAAALRKRVKDIGLEDVYEVIPLGIESLSDPSSSASPSNTPAIAPGSVDCIVSVLCLCSIPDQEDNIRALYHLLKPGGRWYIYEHVKVTRGGLLLKLYQRFVNWPWSFFIGSCRLCCSTRENLLKAGPWTEADITNPVDEPSFALLPHIFGTLTK